MAPKRTTSTKELFGTRVIGGKKGNRRIGKVRRFVFHPSEKRCIGFLVKRPDLLLMFRRKDIFVALDSFELEDGRILLSREKDATDMAACKRLGVDWNACVLWEGLPLVASDGQTVGQVGTVTFDLPSGAVKSVQADVGATAKALLGVKEIPSADIMGFKTGMGTTLAALGSEGAQDPDAPCGAIMVSDDALQIQAEGGLAEAAGKNAAVVGDKAAKTVAKAKPKVKAATKATGKAVDKGAYALGTQVGKTRGMFGAFKDEYEKARNESSSEDE